MAITFTFKVNKIEVAPVLGELRDIVTRVRYDYVGIDEEGNEATFAGATPMPAPESAEYHPLSELTEETVISWLEVHADKTHMQERITKQINAMVTPKYVDTPLPWATEEESITPTPEV